MVFSEDKGIPPKQSNPLENMERLLRNSNFGIKHKPMARNDVGFES